MTVSKTSDLESKKPKVAKKLTKRQKRKLGANPANTWQQQPKLKSTTSRNKAYLHNAGLGSKKAPVNKLDPNLDVINSPEYKFGRLLASPNARTRHATVKKLEAWLKARTDTQTEDGGLSSLDLLKLWKGLWHTLYLCDGVVVQEEVSSLMVSLIWAVGGTLEEDEYAGRFYLELEDSELGEEEMKEKNDEDEREDDDVDSEQDDDAMEIIEMEESDEDEVEDDNEADQEDGNADDDHPIADEKQKHCRGAHLSALLVRTYFQTLSREWSNMDKYRIDKFYTLTRLFMREIYRYMASRHWNLGIIRLFNDALFEEVLRVSKYGNGIRFHVLDICLEELAKVNMDVKDGPGLPLTEAIFMDCLEPFFAMAQRVQDKIVHERVLEKVLLRFLDEYSVVSDNFEVESTSDENEKSKCVLDQVHVGTVAKFLFEIASDPDTLDRNRAQLYEMHKIYVRRIKTVGRDVSLDEEEGEDPVGDESTETQSSSVCEDTSKETKKEETKKSKKKKKKKKKTDKLRTEISKTAGDDEVASSENQNETERAERKKKRKEQSTELKAKDETKRKKGMETSKQSVEVKSTTEAETSSKKKRKKQKQPKKKQMEFDDEVITISIKDQQIAAEAVTKAIASVNEESRKKRNQISKHDSDDSSKKVKFTDLNKAKSYRASIKDLKNVDAKATLEKTPDKGILHASKRRASLFASEGKSKKKKKRSTRKSF